MKSLLGLLGFLRTLTPVGWIATGVIALVGLMLVLGGLGFRWDPFELSRRRADRAEQAAAHATSEAAARAAEAEGQAGQVARLDAAVRSARSLDRATQSSIQIARTADDADHPLPTDRADRLRDHDRRLCRIAPALVGCSAAPDPAADGQPTV